MSRYVVAEDQEIITEQLFLLLNRSPAAAKQVHDANIVATMLAYGIPQLVTYNLEGLSPLRWVRGCGRRHCSLGRASRGGAGLATPASLPCCIGRHSAVSRFANPSLPRLSPRRFLDRF